MNKQEVIEWLEGWLDDDCDALEVPEEFTPEIVEDILDVLCAEVKYLGPITRLRELAQADQDGRCVVLPSKVGDTVYTLFNDEVIERRIGRFVINGHTNPKLWVELDCDFLSSVITRWDISFGVKFFLTHAEAKAAAKTVGTGSEDIEKINRYTLRYYQPEDVYTFSVTLCDNEMERDLQRFSVEALETLRGMLLGKEFIFDHQRRRASQTARVYDTALERAPGRKTKAGEEYVQLKAKAYVPREDINREAIDLIERGIWKEASMACAVKRSVCSVCGQGTCSHVKGEVYDGLLCHRVLMEPTEAYECAFVDRIGGEGK